MVLAPGSQCSQKTKTAEKKTAEAKSGIEVVTIAMKETIRSSNEPGRMPATMPANRPTADDHQQRTASKNAGGPQVGPDKLGNRCTVVGGHAPVAGHEGPEPAAVANDEGGIVTVGSQPLGALCWRRELAEDLDGDIADSDLQCQVNEQRHGEHHRESRLPVYGE